MEIKKVLTELDIGMSNISVEGEVTYTETPENRKGVSKKTNKPYDFWSQRIFIDDGTGSIECSISVKDENDGIEKGVIARVKGKLGEWQENRNIQGKLLGISKGGKETDVQQERAEQYFEEKAKIERLADKVEKPKENPSDTPTSKQSGNIKNNNGYYNRENYWEDKHEWDKHTWKYNRAGMSRSNGVNYAKDMIDILLKHKIIEPKENEVMTYFWGLVGEFGRYIFGGEKPDNGKPKEKKGLLRDDRQPLKIIDEDAPFPGEPSKEEIDEVESAVNKKEKGSSYDNALPFEGKKKALKKVSKAEDFVAADNMPD